MSGLPVVSIVIPCYNQGYYLGECLESLLAQTFLAWEAVVVDDGSTEGDLAYSVSQLKESRIRLIRHAVNRGLGAARNTGFQVARGQLVLSLDADDALESEFLDATVAALQKQSSADCVYTDFQLFGGSSAIWRWPVRSPSDMLEAQWIPGPGTLMRKDLWATVGGYAEMVAPHCGNEDWDFWIAAVQRGVKPLHIAKPLYRYRRTGTSMSVTTLQYYDYVTREFIYRRHRSFFDRHKAGAAFRAVGYVNSSIASSKRGKHVRAAWLALRGFLLQPRLWRAREQLAAAMVPKLLIPVVRQVGKIYPPYKDPMAGGSDRSITDLLNGTLNS